MARLLRDFELGVGKVKNGGRRRPLGYIPQWVRNNRKYQSATIEELCQIAMLKENSVRLWVSMGILTGFKRKNTNRWRDNKVRKHNGLAQDIPLWTHNVMVDAYLDALLTYLGYVDGIAWFAKKLKEVRMARHRIMYADLIERRVQRLKKSRYDRYEEDVY